MEDGRIVGETDYRGKPRVQTVNEDPSMTVQSDSHLADIKQIMKQYALGGMEELDETALVFADVSEFTDYADLMNNVRAAEAHFMTLPSKVREVYGHDVAIFLDHAHDQEKRDALVEAGFLEADEVVDDQPPGTTTPPDPDQTASTQENAPGPE